MRRKRRRPSPNIPDPSQPSQKTGGRVIFGGGDLKRALPHREWDSIPHNSSGREENYRRRQQGWDKRHRLQSAGGAREPVSLLLSAEGETRERAIYRSSMGGRKRGLAKKGGRFQTRILHPVAAATGGKSGQK